MAARARSVHVEHQRIDRYAAELSAALAQGRPVAAQSDTPCAEEHAAAFWLTLNTVNFGSGWFPTLRKRPGSTGYRTIAAGIAGRFQTRGPWSAQKLSEITRDDLAMLLDQDVDHELIGLFAAALQDLGERLLAGYDGSFEALVAAADGSAQRLVETLAGWDCFADSSTYEGIELPFLKRAQIAAADLHRAGVAQFADLDRLTMFADNLVPHVLRLDGVLSFAPELVERIERAELIEHGSREEVEIRACAVHAVELLVAATSAPVTAMALDEYLWNRGQGAEYKARPRHRSRSTAY